jgi:hypothetical protein
LLPVETSDCETISQADIDCSSANVVPPDPRFCPKGTKDDCVLVQTMFWSVKMICGLKRFYVFSIFISKQDWSIFR